MICDGVDCFVSDAILTLDFVLFCFLRHLLLVYGGVDNGEGDNHKMRSVVYDDLFSFEMERRRWFRLGLKKEKVAGA